ncbi:MAG: hypothetical protein K1Y36_19100 [Blastocatellia bacterium]|nr:hypothetical protein [Blastocatellia bacterium]
MKRFLMVLALALIWLPGWAQQMPRVPAAVAPFVQGEYDFTRTAKAKGTRAAFLEFLADDAVLFRPTPVPGKKWVEATPSQQDWLNWYPVFVDAAQSGDMGYTTGPWDYRPKVTDEKAVAFGHFISIWKKQPDGSFKVVLDNGIKHTEPKVKIEPIVQTPPAVANAGTGKKADVVKETADLLKVDEAFSKLSQDKGWLPAYLSVAAQDIRLYREPNLPFVGRDKLRQASLGPDTKVTWKPERADVSQAGDMGYTYGISEASPEVSVGTQKAEAAQPSKTTRSMFLHIWKKQADGQWKLVLDVENVIPDKPKG